MRVSTHRLRLAPLAVALILVTTAVPIEFRGEAAWSMDVGAKDFIQNLLLYAPLGVALWRSPAWRVGALAGALSLLVEVAQLWQAGRFAAPADLAANLLGAVGASLLYRMATRGRAASPVEVRLTRPRLLLALVVTLHVLVSWAAPVRPSDLSDWDPTYPLQLGNERTPVRPWRGEIASLRILSGPQAGGALRTPEYESIDRVVLGGGPALVLPADVSSRFARSAISEGAFTVRVRLSTADIHQQGPARIVSFSADTMHRNFDLGQQGRRLVLRVRTPVSGLNGQAHRVTSEPVLVADREVDVDATYDGAIARIYVDGVLSGRSNIAAAGCKASAFCDWAAPPAWGMIGGVLMMLALAALPIGSARGLLLAAVGAGAATVALVWPLPLYPLLAGASGLLPLLAFVGSASVAFARMRATAS